ncbi:bacterial regulatory protein, arsr family [Halogeometricum borinquense DSM 11551]|uniref:Bacterial regulatory protein, ArsR family n=1 Tax=Halogeometricum borinquense (strain ATCC 700274 / DSM 11551 / JCM 10706 / KCTC 4070 / PR3) TaxID=469382 RepID=E4NM21_HALBP|nr:winged helix-turn-helix domain-containing protein [Halogeometricum borinquense]ADQ66120.1 Bacterial regulatory protein, arsR family [Halogeometricum borinquense DSM 11551]ELY27385.1 bacterial regulatory protein, arsr family [Halogeometricum borinquense DSM 11551]
MSSLLPLKPPVDGDGTDPRLVSFDDSDAEEIVSVVTSETAREILAAVYEEPQTTSDLASSVDTSVQNVSYHLDRLKEAGVVEAVGTWYSAQGREMNVYGPKHDPLVLYAETDQARSSVSDTLRRSLAGVAGVLVASLLVHVAWPTPVPVRPTRGAPLSPEPTLFEAVRGFALGPGGAVLAVGLIAVFFMVGFRYLQSSQRGTDAE